MYGMTDAQVRELCLAVGSLIRAAACWGDAKATAGDTEFAERAIHFWLGETLKAALLRAANAAEIEIVWEV